MRFRSLQVLLGAALTAALLVVAPLARADEGKGKSDRVELRQNGVCSMSSRVELRVRAEEGSLRVQLEVDTSRNGAPWAVVLLHERRIVFRGTFRTAAPSGSFELRRTVVDWFGPDAIVARATGPRGESCRAAVVV